MFGHSDSLTDGFNKNLKKLESSDLPTESVNDIGMNPTSFKSKDIRMDSLDTTNNYASMQTR